MVIAFEGMDGVGKTSVARRTAKKLNYEYEEKILKNIMNINEINYLKLIKKIRTSSNKNASAAFFTLKMILDNDTNENRIVDRSVLSFYYFEKNNIEKDTLANIIKLGVIPDLIIILYASVETRIQRIYGRNPKDIDLQSEEVIHDGYKEMLDFVLENNIKYIGINTELLNTEDVSTICSNIISSYNILEDNKKEKFIKDMNDVYGFDSIYTDSMERKLK